MEFEVGDRVWKPDGYPFPGTVVCAFLTLASAERYVVESDLSPGMLHIFSGRQLRHHGGERQQDATPTADRRAAEDEDLRNRVLAPIEAYRTGCAVLRMEPSTKGLADALAEARAVE